MAAVGGRSPAAAARKDLLPGEVLEYAFLYLNREGVEALQIGHRYFHHIISTERFGNAKPLRCLKRVDLANDTVVIRTNGQLKRIHLEDAVRWLRNTCVENLDMHANFLVPEQAQRALRWFVAHRSEFRVINISVNLPSVSAELIDAFLHPDPSHHWTSAVFDGRLSGNMPLAWSSLENVERLDVLGPNLRVAVGDVICWLHRPASPFVDVNYRQLSLAEGTIDGDLQPLLERIRENFMTAMTSRAFGVTIECRRGDVLLANGNAPFRKYNRHAGDLLSIEVIEGGSCGKQISIRRRPFP